MRVVDSKFGLGGLGWVGDGGGATYVFCRTVQGGCARHPEKHREGGGASAD